MSTEQSIAEYDRPTVETFRNEIYPAAKPAIMRGLGADLKPVKLALTSSTEFADYLKQAVGPRNVDVLCAKDKAASTFFFDGDVSRFNFDRAQMSFPEFVDRLVDLGTDGRMLYMEATGLPQLSARLAGDLKLPFAPKGTDPYIWIGNRTRVQIHFDYKQNIACAVSGRRRFTIFPPEQTPNLYMAPFERSPSNAPISMVDLDDPNYEQHPRFRKAQEHALIATLEPGDALFLPYMWWHHVEAIDKFNVLVNYWWNEHEGLGSPVEAMLHSILTLRDMPPPMRDAWKAMFDTFVFKSHGEPMEHIRPELRGGLGPLDGAQRGELWSVLASFMMQHVQRMRGDGGRS